MMEDKGLNHGSVELMLGAIIEERNISPGALARATGLSRQACYDMANQRTCGITFNTVAILCDVLNITPSDLLFHRKD